MNNLEDLKPKSIVINIVFIIIFTIGLIDNVSSLYDDTHLKFAFHLIFAILDVYLVLYNTKDLFNKKKYNKNLKKGS